MRKFNPMITSHTLIGATLTGMVLHEGLTPQEAIAEINAVAEELFPEILGIKKEREGAAANE